MTEDRALLAEQITERADEIRSLMANMGNTMLLLGHRLKRFADDKSYRALGYDSMEKCVEDEFGMKKSTYHYLVSIFVRFAPAIAKSPEFARIDYTKLRLATQLVTPETPDKVVIEVLTNAQRMSSRDFEDYVRVQKGGKSRFECSHESWKYFRKCPVCGWVDEVGQPDHDEQETVGGGDDESVRHGGDDQEGIQGSGVEDEGKEVAV